ncbi:MAG: YlbF family regulator [Gemmatimonadetes bacterium]|nr:YlbF family regulator [Gemmatimonadota bacterium]MYE94778.1 YlbF family regulator [Gemmatimonadota bacterium]MYJ11264.1 YlbF family regulator [Gemmatimonadota bacterium]
MTTWRVGGAMFLHNSLRARETGPGPHRYRGSVARRASRNRSRWMSEIEEMAGSLGRALGRTPEYRTLARALESADDDRDIVALRNEVRELERRLQEAIAGGKEPDKETMAQFEAAVGRLQASSVYQSVVAAQSNFDRIMHRVDAEIHKGMREGAASRIILTT